MRITLDSTVLEVASGGIEQGALGNCYLCATMNGIGQRSPQYLEGRILDFGGLTATQVGDRVVFAASPGIDPAGYSPVGSRGTFAELTTEKAFALERASMGTGTVVDPALQSPDPYQSLWDGAMRRMGFGSPNEAAGYGQDPGGSPRGAMEKLGLQNTRTIDTMVDVSIPAVAARPEIIGVAASKPAADLPPGTSIVPNHAYTVEGPRGTEVELGNPWGRGNVSLDQRGIYEGFNTLDVGRLPAQSSGPRLDEGTLRSFANQLPFDHPGAQIIRDAIGPRDGVVPGDTAPRSPEAPGTGSSFLRTAGHTFGGVALGTGLVESLAKDGVLPQSLGNVVAPFNHAVGTVLAPFSPSGNLAQYVTDATGSNTAGFLSGVGTDLAIYRLAGAAGGLPGTALVAAYSALDYAANRSDFAQAGNIAKGTFDRLGIPSEFGTFGGDLANTIRGSTTGILANIPETNRAFTNFAQLYGSNVHSGADLRFTTPDGYGPADGATRDRLLALSDVATSAARDTNNVGGAVFFPDGTQASYVDPSYLAASTNLQRQGYGADYLENFTREEVLRLNTEASLGLQPGAATQQQINAVTAFETSQLFNNSGFDQGNGIGTTIPSAAALDPFAGPAQVVNYDNTYSTADYAPTPSGVSADDANLNQQLEAFAAQNAMSDDPSGAMAEVEAAQYQAPQYEAPQPAYDGGGEPEY